MARSIPPRTMSDVWKKGTGRSKKIIKASGAGPGSINIGLGTLSSGGKRDREKKPFKPKRFKRPKEWVYETKPFFKKVKEPLIDVFKEAQEVRVIIDLGGFMRGDVDFHKAGDKFIISGKRDEHEYIQEIPLPPGVDADRIEEHFKNGILELVLPKKKIRSRYGKKNKNSGY